MSIPGEAKSKYTHEVSYRSKCGWYKIVALIFALFVAGMLIAILCKIHGMRHEQDYMHREIHRLHWKIDQLGNNQQFHSYHCSNIGPQSAQNIKDHHQNDNGHNHHSHHHPHPHHHHHKNHHHHNNDYNPSIDESLNEIKSILKNQFSKLESKAEELNKGINSKEQFTEKMMKQLREFQDYMHGLLEPLKKIQSWF